MKLESLNSKLFSKFEINELKSLNKIAGGGGTTTCDGGCHYSDSRTQMTNKNGDVWMETDKGTELGDHTPHA